MRSYISQLSYESFKAPVTLSDVTLSFIYCDPLINKTKQAGTPALLSLRETEIVP